MPGAFEYGFRKSNVKCDLPTLSTAWVCEPCHVIIVITQQQGSALRALDHVAVDLF